MVDEIHDSNELPATASDVAETYPDVWDAYGDLGKACSHAGPIDGETKRLVKLALAVGAQSEGAVHSHVLRGLEEDVDPDALRHVAMLATPTIGFPKSVAALTWIDDLAD
jgi:alkylhydroperoxidase/carboxymuconolactone decarboxylase family protein YurZ